MTLTFNQLMWPVVGTIVFVWWVLIFIMWLGAVKALFYRRPSELEMSARRVMRHCRQLLPLSVVTGIVLAIVFPRVREHWLLAAVMPVVLAVFWPLSAVMERHGRRTYPYASGGPIRKISS